ncbi:16S rRNA (guanine(966)-N(2))-methyltransferase RsmD [Edaphobacter acidisoli]|nr:16S rRNA (guanine(966)-N(2))-methyltransferase RsmD [Edaphobacter acidisoli]
MATRPTSDKLRGTLFNILAPRIEGCRFVDLYAGTGAVGIEALSRGAGHVWFAEKAAPAVATIRANLAALKVERGFTLEARGVRVLLERLSGPVDVVFLDPPYEAAAEYAGTLEFLGSRDLLAPGGVVVAEHGSKVRLAERYGALVQTRVVKQGDAALSFFALGE